MRTGVTSLHCPSAWTGQSLYYRDFVNEERIGKIFVIVEIGVHYGYSLFCMAYDFPKAKVVGIDKFIMSDSEEARAHLKKHLPSHPNAMIIEADSTEMARKWSDPSIYLDIDVLHIDGEHDYNQVKSDFDNWSKYVRPGGAVMFHDVESFPEGPGKFFDELEGEKERRGNLGVWFKEQ